MLARVVKQLMPLLETVNESALAVEALELWHQYAPLQRAWFLRLSFDGRTLQVIAQLDRTQLRAVSIQGASFNCATFDQPFSHVAFNAKALVLQQLSQHPDLSHVDYQTWIKGADADTQLLVEPLYLEGKLQGLWAIQSKRNQDVSNGDTKAIQQLVALRLAQLLDDKNTQTNHTNLVSSFNSLHAGVISTQHKERLASSIIGTSKEVDKLQDKIIVAARSKLNVLVNGETGVGKELVAKAIHQLSDRADQPFIALNCAAIPDSLLESELFGFVKGAFSGAQNSSKGLLGQAHGGVFFLDEIGDMPLAIQAKLLRVLETREYRQLGGSEEMPCDFRLVAATHRHLPQLIKQQGFRSDLFYRLNSFPIFVAPLRERKSDIPLLSKFFIEQFNRMNQRMVKGITDNAMAQLNGLNYSGNIRELKNIIELACVHCNDAQSIDQIDISGIENIYETEANSHVQVKPPLTIVDSNYEKISNLKAAVEQFEVQVIEARLVQCRGNKTKAAATLGVPRRTFTHICQRLELNNREK